MSIHVSGPLVLLLVLFVAVAPAHAQQTVLRASVFGAGGGPQNSAGFTLHGTVGQPLQGRLAGTTFVAGGFWHPARPAAGPLARPTANDDTVRTDEDTPVALDVLANDADPTGGSLTIIAVSAPAHGSVLVSGVVVTYTPEADFFGGDAFTYTIANTLGGTATAEVTISVEPVNDAPHFTSTPVVSAAVGASYTYPVETADVEGDAVSITASALPPWLSLDDHGDGTATLSGTPADADAGAHPVTLSASDGTLTAEQAFTVTVEVGGVAAPQLVAPEDGAVVAPPVVQLRWQAVPGATAYDVQADTQADFSSPVEARGVTNTEVELTGLPDNVTVFWRVRATDATGPGPFSAAFHFTTATNVATEGEAATPSAYALHPNYPNPFNPTTTLAYDLAQAAEVRLVVYDLFGRAVKTLVNARQAAGRYTVAFEAGALASGTYFYRIEAGAWSQVRQFVLLK